MARRKVLAERYELEQLPLARGAMGEVWVGHDTRLDREVAVKFVRFQDGAPEDELTRRFVRESRITARLQHPGVPAVFDVGTEDGRPYLVMQRVHGSSVHELLAKHERLPVGWAAAIAAQVCSVFAAAHDVPLVHRDLKPANLILEPDGTVKVLDFGLAVALDLADASQITRSGQNVGTPAYMAPEQVLAAISSPQTDLYSLGCTLYEMLTGEHVFTGATSYSVMNQQVDQPAPAARSLCPDVPTGLDALVRELLEKSPENRPASAQASYERLLPFVTGLHPLPGPQPPAAPDPVRMYATVLSRAFTAPEPPEPTAPAEPEPAEPGPEQAVPRSADPETISRARLETVRAEASQLATEARYQEAAGLLETAVRDAGHSFGADDTEAVTVRLEWANILFEGGDYRGAAPLFQTLAAELSERDGAGTELVFRCRQQYATCQAQLGNTAAALDEAQALLAEEQRTYRARDPRPFELRRQIGLWQLAAGRREEALATLESLLAELLETFGEHYPVVPQIRELIEGMPG